MTKSAELQQLGRTKKAYLTAITSLLQTGISLLLGFLITPYIVRTLTPNLYGIWLYVIQFVGFLAIIDIFPGSSLKLQLATASIEGGDSLKRRHVGAHLLLALCAFPLYVLAGAIGYLLLPKFVPDFSIHQNPIILSATILLLTAAINKILATPGLILRGENLDYKANVFRSTVMMITSLLDVVVVFAGFGLVGLALSKLIGAVALAVTLGSIAKANVPWLGWERPSFEQIKGMFQINWWIYVSNLAWNLTTGTDLLILGYFLGAYAVSVYAITGTISRFGFSLLAGILQSANPGMGELFGKKSFEKLNEVRRVVEAATLLLGGTVATVCIGLNRDFISHWMEAGLYGGLWVNTFLTVLALVLLIGKTQQNFLTSILDMRSAAVVYLLSAIVTVIAELSLVRPFGAAGLALGGCIGAIMAMMLNRRAIVKSIPSGHQAESFSRIYSVVVFCGVAGCLFNYFVAVNSWTVLAIHAIILGAISFFVIWFGGIDSSTRSSLLSYAKVTLKRAV